MANSLRTKNRWKLEDAKARFSEVVRQAAKLGPQVVTVRGTEQAVILSIAEYRRLSGADQPPSLEEFFESWEMPAMVLDRGADHEREVKL